MVEYEVSYIPRQIPISKACALVWNCTDIVPSGEFDVLEEFGPKRRTYAACARAMAKAMKDRHVGWQRATKGKFGCA
jgi:hypothetical protein